MPTPKSDEKTATLGRSGVAARNVVGERIQHAVTTSVRFFVLFRFGRHIEHELFGRAVIKERNALPIGNAKQFISHSELMVSPTVDRNGVDLSSTI